MPSYTPSVDELRARNTVGINSETVTNIASTDFPGHFTGEDHAWDISKFRESLSVKFYQNEEFNASFSLVGVDASIANAFRRILLAELPILAIERCHIWQNTSIMQDEVLAHRLGLVPLKANSDGLKWLQEPKTPPEGQDYVPVDRDTIILSLHKVCTWNPDRDPDEDDPVRMYNNAHIYARDLKFQPTASQLERFGEDGVAPVNPDILLLKMRPGQEIKIDMHAVKGFGWDHAKFSPVATASYRLLPTIDILKPIVGEDAVKFQGCFAKGVIGLEEVTDKEANKMNSEYEGLAGQMKAVVKDAFRDTVSREALRHEEFQDKVKLGRVRDHFIFSVESTGQEKSDELFLRSVEVLKRKARECRIEVENSNYDYGDDKKENDEDS